jgi:hypothetical protein
MENHDFGSVFCPESLEQVESEGAQSTIVGDHINCDSSLQNEFQKGTQTRVFNTCESGIEVSIVDPVAGYVPTHTVMHAVMAAAAEVIRDLIGI